MNMSRSKLGQVSELPAHNVLALFWSGCTAQPEGETPAPFRLGAE